MSEKLLSLFGKEIVINKKLLKLVPSIKKVPSFCSDFLISSLIDINNPGPGIEKINKLITENYADADKVELIKSKIKENNRHGIIGHVRARYDQTIDEYFADIGALGDQGIRVSYNLISKLGDNLLTKGSYGSSIISFDPVYKIKSKMYPFVLTDFTPLQITSINLDQFINNRSQFDLEEWIDIIINSIGFNPEYLSFDEKMFYIIRLLVFVEPNLNIIELGGVETGKTYTYRNVSGYSFIISGAQITSASLFYNKLRKKIGVIGHSDVVVFDEIAHANFSNQDDLINILKDYLNDGKFSRGDINFSSEASIVFIGNIDCIKETKSVQKYYRHLLSPLPRSINNDRAFLDRIHGYLPGWIAPKISESMMSSNYAFMSDYLSEIFHILRSRDYTNIILSRISFKNMSFRNQKSIVKMSSALIKLLFPNKNSKSISKEELKFIIDQAIDLRKRITDQLAIISPGEFSNISFDYEIKNV